MSPDVSTLIQKISSKYKRVEQDVLRHDREESSHNLSHN